MKIFKIDMIFLQVLAITLAGVLRPGLPLTEDKFVLVGSYTPVYCTYNGTLENKVFFMMLSWDHDDSIAYLFRNQLHINEDTDVYRMAKQHGFNVESGTPTSQTMSLIINAVRLDYQGLKVVCLVKDDDGRGPVLWRGTTVLKVIDPPQILRFKDTSVNVTRGENKKVELVCAASGYPAPMVRWRRRNSNEVVQPQSFDRSTLTARCQLPTPFSVAEDGNYLCEAVTSHPYMEDIGLHRVVRSIRVNVQYPPEIHSGESIVYTDVGDEVISMVDVAGNPQPHLQCSFLDIRDAKYVRVFGHPSPHRFRYQVVLPHVRPHHVTDYPCHATNQLGTARTVIRLRYGPSRPSVLSPRRSPYSNFYGLKWSVLSKARLHNFTVELSKRNRSGAVTSVRADVVSLLHMRRVTLEVNQTFLYDVTNLTADTNFGIRVRTCNRYHCSPYSRTTTFRTAVFDGMNVMEKRQPPTRRPSNLRDLIQMVKRCPPYGIGHVECSGLVPQPSLLPLVAAALLRLLH